MKVKVQFGNKVCYIRERAKKKKKTELNLS